MPAYYVVECVTHNYEKYDPKKRENYKPRLFLNDITKGSPIHPDVVWLQSITRQDSGTYFTVNEEFAVQFQTEEAADERVTEIILELGYLPSDVVAALIEPPKEEVRDEA